ncbi:hypothetical protein ZWY2020_020622 [Hordeum vulgare]|nr:hypothetical protein ZWY2020_020622 [Hordeum vulgare]
MDTSGGSGAGRPVGALRAPQLASSRRHVQIGTSLLHSRPISLHRCLHAQIDAATPSRSGRWSGRRPWVRRSPPSPCPSTPPSQTAPSGTLGGRYRANYKYAPFVAKFGDLVLHGCPVNHIYHSVAAACGTPWYEPVAARRTSVSMSAFRRWHISYSYCHDRYRYSVAL